MSRPSVAASDQLVDPNYDYEKHKNIVYTMATCHSLKVVEDELLGDPLDVKMFQFTGWSYQEGESRTLEQNIKYDTIVPSVAKPPYHISNCGQCNTHVSSFFHHILLCPLSNMICANLMQGLCSK